MTLCGLPVGFEICTFFNHVFQRFLVSCSGWCALNRMWRFPPLVCRTQNYDYLVELGANIGIKIRERDENKSDPKVPNF